MRSEKYNFPYLIRKQREPLKKQIEEGEEGHPVSSNQGNINFQH